MKNRLFYIAISIFSLALGTTAVWFYYRYESPQIQTQNEAITVNTSTVPKFRYISGSSTCSPVYYRFQSSTEPKVFSVDGIFSEEVGNTSVHKQSNSPEQIQFLFKAYSENGIVEKSIKTDKNGSKIGDKVVWISKHNAKIESASIVWTENADFWVINAPTLELVKEFEESETFKSIKEEVVSACVSK